MYRIPDREMAGLRAAADEQNARDASAQGSDELQAVALGAQQSYHPVVQERVE